MVFQRNNRVLGFVCAVSVGVCSLASAQECTPMLVEQLFDSEPGVQSIFGSSVRISGDTAFVGVHRDVIDGVDTGSVHIFRFDGGGWIFEDRIAPEDGDAGQIFGAWLSVDDDLMLVGSPRDNDLGLNSGAVYAYQLIDGKWAFIQKIHASDGKAEDWFGIVDLEGERAVIGAPGIVGGPSPGAMYIFEFDGQSWVEVQKIAASDGGNGDIFGLSPKLDGDRLIAGAPWALNELFFRHGAVYIFEHDGTEWIETYKLEPDIFDFDHTYGLELAISGDMIFVGDPMGLREERPGEIAVYQLVDGEWGRVQILIPATINETQSFGDGPILCQNDVLIVGVPFTRLGVGEVIVYTLVDGLWVQSTVIQSPSNQPEQLFGARIGLDRSTIMIASPRFDNDMGMVSVYDLGCLLCQADFTSDGLLDFLDVSAFLQAFGNNDLSADFTDDGLFNFFDISAFLIAFNAGCP